ncbi:MAG: CPBP family intramembrane metalloprotease domain-containing protein [Candidatus Cloacimonetes bacterium HGW-Cloacimonetes-1]|jgi:sodium transport system permease protein|nr:MAG: CPBP family intramembrane metalloprotease domain-containing protein [Candidatus Cloacimonetes bacterium HGW-Cloacimonetes-1]
MSFSKSLVVYRKEMMELFRDKRTIFSSILLPIILYPVLFIGLTSLMSRQTKVIEKEGATIAIVDSVQNDVSALILKNLMTINNFQFMPYTPESDKLYEDKDVQGILSITDSLTIDQFAVYKVNLQFDKSSDQGEMLFRKIQNNVDSTRTILQEESLQKVQISPMILKILDIIQFDTSSSQKKMGKMMGSILPYLLVMTLLSGAMAVASDLVAGEKERKTLETLLVCSVHRNEIVIGKYMAIITFALINVFVNLISLYFSISYTFSRSGMELAGISFPINSMLLILAAFVPLAMLVSAILLSLSTFSRNMKEFGSYGGPLMMVSMMLAMVSFLPGVELSNAMALIPVINIALLFKAVMIDEYTITHFLITVGSTLLLSFAAIWASIRIFNSESVLFRGDDESSLKNVKKDKRNLFNPYYGMVYMVLALVALYYLGSAMQTKDLSRGLVNTQLLIILLPVLLVLRIFKLKPKEILRLKAPKPVEMVLIPFIAIPAAMIVSSLAGLINQIYPFPPGYLEKMSSLFTMSDNTWIVLLIVAVLPGICEEILFRGFLMRFFEQYGTKLSVVIVAMLFAAFHLDPFRFIPVLLLGLLLGYLTVRSGSIINSMLSHTINNGFAVVVSTYGTSMWIKPLLMDSETIKPLVLIPAAAIFAVALYMFHKVTTPKET